MAVTSAVVTAGLGIYGAVENSAQAAAARRAQEKQQAAQEAVQNRQTIAAENQAQTLDLQNSDQLRAIAAGRRGQGGLAYAGAQLKTTLGG